MSLHDTKIQTWFTYLDDDKIGTADSDQEMGDNDEENQEELEKSLVEVLDELDQASTLDISLSRDWKATSLGP
ncbi:hypothetical protein APHAL10511_008577, partial [Amanita phalloides]